jgi:hypothetical protein
MEVAKLALTDVAKTAGGLYVADVLNIRDKLPSGGTNLITRNLARGVLYAGVSDGVEAVSGNKSKILSGDVIGLLDDTVFLGGLSLGSEALKLDETIYSTISGALNTSQATTEAIAEGVIISVGRFTSEMLSQYIRDGTASQTTAMIRHPVSFLVAQTKTQ